MISKRCSVCGSDRVSEFCKIDGYQLARCTACTHVFVSDELADGELNAAYSDAYYRAANASNSKGYDDYLRDADARTRAFKDRLQKIEARVAKPGRLLDYGCAVGLFVKVAADSGWQATGYERSAWAVQYGRETLGVEIVLGDGGDVSIFDRKFDVITMWDVLEHLEHPREVLTSMHDLLLPGGLLVLSTVNRSAVGARLAKEHWRHFAPPHHLQYFSRASLQRLLSDCGFKSASMRNTGVMLGADSRKRNLSGIAHLAESLATHWRAAPIATALNLLDEVEIVSLRK